MHVHTDHTSGAPAQIILIHTLIAPLPSGNSGGVQKAFLRHLGPIEVHYS